MPASAQAHRAPLLVLASRNRKKLRDMELLLSDCGITLLSAADIPDLPDVEEAGDTFADNAARKAREVALHSGRWAIGDDSGLVVDALNGEPGVFSARYAGPDATDQTNNEKLLTRLAHVRPERRTARFECHLAVADPNGVIQCTAAGQCRGFILDASRGDAGFGYDPLFCIREYNRTFAELSPLAKSVLSHRGRAMAQLRPRLLRTLREETG
jgi:XTP/dITP diphosphohydrolase